MMFILDISRLQTNQVLNTNKRHFYVTGQIDDMSVWEKESSTHTLKKNLHFPLLSYTTRNESKILVENICDDAILLCL